MKGELTVQDLPKGIIGSLGYGRLFFDIRNSPDVPKSLVIAFRDSSNSELSALECTLTQHFGPSHDEPFSSVPGRDYRRIFSGSTNPQYHLPFKPDRAVTQAVLDVWYDSSQAGYKPDRAVTRAVLDVWNDSSQAGYCVYIVGSSRLQQEIESWGAAQGRHATLYVTTQLESSGHDRSLEWRRQMVKYIDTLPKNMPLKELHRVVIEKDQPKLVRDSFLPSEEINFLLLNLFPNYEVSQRYGYPELLKKN